MTSWRTTTAALALAAAFGIALLAQAPNATSPPLNPGTPATLGKPSPLVVTGCIAGSSSGAITVQDQKKGVFELMGRGLDVYIGKRVELRGNATGLHITTGLYPTPNVAAQAGAIDPVQAAQAAMPGGAAHGTGAEPLPRFDVMRVRTVKGDCK